MAKINSGIVCAEPLTEEQLRNTRKRVLENGEAIACIDHNKELCFLLPTDPRGIEDLAWDRAEELFMQEGSPTVFMNQYRKSDINAFYLAKTLYSTDFYTAQTPSFINRSVAVYGFSHYLLTGGRDEVVIGAADKNKLQGAVYIPSEVPYGNDDAYRTVGIGSFNGCTNITYVNIPPSVTTISYAAFGACPNLVEIDLGNCEADGVQNILLGTSSLQTISVATNNKTYSSIDGVLFDASKNTLLAFPSGRSGSYTLPQGTMSLAGMSFVNCTNLTSLTFSAYTRLITDPDKPIFYHCDNLTDIWSPTTRSDFTYSSYGQTWWWSPVDSSKIVTVHCTDGDLLVSTTDYTYI